MHGLRQLCAVILITQIIHKQGRFRIFATILADSDEAYKQLAREDIGLCTRDFSELEEESSAILPAELWVEIKQLSNQMISILVEYDKCFLALGFFLLPNRVHARPAAATLKGASRTLTVGALNQPQFRDHPYPRMVVRHLPC